MEKKLKFFTITSWIFVAIAGAFPLFAGDITEDAANVGFQLLEEPQNPRSLAMGATGTALDGQGFAYYNPAKAFLAKQSYLTVDFGNYNKADLHDILLESSVLLTNWFVSLSLRNTSVDDIYETNFWGNLPFYDVPFSSQLTAVSLAAGYSQWEDFAIAVCVNGVQDRIHDSYAYALSLSAGAVLKIIPDHLTAGLSMTHLGNSTPMLGDDKGSTWGEGEKLPFNSRLGIAWNYAIKSMPFTAALDIVYRNVRDAGGSFTRRIQDRFTVPLGLEFQPLDFLAIRMGKRFNHRTELLSFGAGLRLDPLEVNLSFVAPKLVDDAQIKWHTSVTYYLRKKSGAQQPDKPIKPAARTVVAPDTVSAVDKKVAPKPQPVIDTTIGNQGVVPVPKTTGSDAEDADTLISKDTPSSGDSLELLPPAENSNTGGDGDLLEESVPIPQTNDADTESKPQDIPPPQIPPQENEENP